MFVCIFIRKRLLVYWYGCGVTWWEVHPLCSRGDDFYINFFFVSFNLLIIRMILLRVYSSPSVLSHWSLDSSILQLFNPSISDNQLYLFLYHCKYRCNSDVTDMAKVMMDMSGLPQNFGIEFSQLIWKIDWCQIVELTQWK